jgi:hypothetical protein
MALLLRIFGVVAMVENIDRVSLAASRPKIAKISHDHDGDLAIHRRAR